jgi:membrane protein required for colicin V production
VWLAQHALEQLLQRRLQPTRIQPGHVAASLTGGASDCNRTASADATADTRSAAGARQEGRDAAAPVRQNDHVLGQAPDTHPAVQSPPVPGLPVPPPTGHVPGPTPTGHTPTGAAIDALQHLGWIDITALSLLGVFIVVGLFKGFLWQVSRVAILVVAYGTAARFGDRLGDQLLQWTVSSPNGPSTEQRETAFYVGCVLIFLGVLIVLSLLALLLQKLITRAGMGFFDRLFGGVVGIGTGSVVVLFLMTLVLMFFPRSAIAKAAESSHSLEFSRWAMDRLAGVLPPELHKVFVPAAEARGPAMQPMTTVPGGVAPADAPKDAGFQKQPHPDPKAPDPKAQPPAQPKRG